MPFYLRSACRAQDTPVLRTHALLSKFATRLYRCGLLPPGKLGSLSADSIQSPWEWVARHTLRASMYRRQRTNQKKRSQTPCSTKSLSSAASDKNAEAKTAQNNKVTFIGRLGQKRRSQNRSEQQRVRHPQHRNPGKLEERQGRIREPHRVAPRLRLEESLEVRQDAPEGAAHHPGRHPPVSRGRG